MLNISCMVFDGDLICIGSTTHYTIIRLGDGPKIQAIPFYHIPVAGVPPACEILAPCGQLVLSTSSQLGVFVWPDGLPVPERFPLEWSQPPLVIRAFSSYILALLPAAIQLFSTDHSFLLQEIPLDQPNCIMSPRVPGSQGLVLASISGIGILRPMPIQQQIEYHISSLNLVRAQTMFVIGDPSPSDSKLFDIRLASHLLNHLLFRDAFQKFNLIGNGIHPRELLILFPIVNSPLVIHEHSVDSLEQFVAIRKESIASNKNLNICPEKIRVQLLDIIGRDTNEIVHEAMLESVRYFWERRNHYLDPDSLTIIDTTLLQLLVKLPSSIPPPLPSFRDLLLPTNYCLIPFSTNLLEQVSPDGLGFLFEAQGSRNGALMAWSRSGSTLALTNAVRVLSCLCPSDPVFAQFAPWVLSSDSSAAGPLLAQTPSPEAMTYLSSLGLPSLLPSYLRHMILDRGSLDPDLHTALALQYLKEEEDEEGRDQGRLLAFLTTSTAYDATTLNKALQAARSLLPRERIALLSRLQDHDAVLQVYIDELHDIDGAVRYGQTLSYPSKIGDLARLLLQHPGTPVISRSVFIQAALGMIHRHLHDLDPLLILDLLPPDMPLVDIAPLLSKMLPSATTNRRFAQIERGLSRVERFRSEKTLIEMQMKSVRIESCTLCRGCHQQINGRPFIIYGTRILHSKCS